ncbi:MAG: response regulator [Elainellaceae cyanobacterium]
MKILLVESDSDIVIALVKRLTAHHVVVDVVKDAEEGWTYGSTFGYDLIVIGGRSPQIDGVSLCQQFREEGFTLPILLLIAQNTQGTLVRALDAGADDCMVCPFEMDELHARIRVLSRRGRANPFPVMVWGDLMLNSSTCEVTYRDQPIVLTAKEYGLLELFLRDTQHVFSIEEILENLWSSEEFPSEATVRSHLRRLRHKLQEAGAASDFIATAHGRGYYIKASDHEVNASHRSVEMPSVKGANHRDEGFSRSSAEVSLSRSNPEPIAHVDQGQALHHPVLLIVSHDETIAHALATSAKTQGIRVAIAPSLEQAKPWLVPNGMCPYPDAILIRTPVMIEAAHGANPVSSFASRSVSPQEMSSVSKAQKASANLERTLDTLRLMGSHHLRVPIGIINAAATWSDRLLATRHGCTLFLAEPIDPEQAIAALLPMVQVNSQAIKVLAIDADLAWLQAMLTILTPWGFEVITLDDVEPLMTVLENINPDVIILDINLPSSNGLENGTELCRLLRNDPKWRHLPIIFLSEAIDTTLKEQALSAGADDYLMKPIQGKELSERIMARLQRLQFSAAIRQP